MTKEQNDIIKNYINEAIYNMILFTCNFKTSEFTEVKLFNDMYFRVYKDTNDEYILELTQNQMTPDCDNKLYNNITIGDICDESYCLTCDCAIVQKLGNDMTYTLSEGLVKALTNILKVECV